MLTAEIWPTLDYSRVPYRLYHDAEAYEREQERIFRGPTWHFLALAAEIPKNGDFRATQVGDTPGHRQSRRRWLNSRLRQSLRSPRRAGAA